MPMKFTLLVSILAMGLLPGLSQQAEANHCGHHSHVYICGYDRCGSPIYKVRYISGYDRCGRAIWRTRALTCYERKRYYRSCHSYRPRYSGAYHGRSSYPSYGHSRITYSKCNGRGYTLRYSSSPIRCKIW